MKREEWDGLAQRIAMVRHKRWCIEGHYEGDLDYTCQGPKMGDLQLGEAIATELWGKRPEGEPDVSGDD